MYDTLIMLKPGEAFGAEALRALVAGVVAGNPDATLSARGGTLRVEAAGGRSWIAVTPNESRHVAEESDDIARRYGLACAGCRSRLEMNGEDPGMDLFNEYLLINERLHATGKFVVFDCQECKAMFD